MSLKIEHSTHEENGKIIYRADYTLVSGDDDGDVGDWMKSVTLEELEREWFILHGDPSARDVNAHLVNEVAALKNATPSTSRQGVCVKLENPIVVAACGEFVMRACAMASDGHRCCLYLRTRERTFDLRELRASGKALPDLGTGIREASAC
jgi:hypothetical protein